MEKRYDTTEEKYAQLCTKFRNSIWRNIINRESQSPLRMCGIFFCETHTKRCLERIWYFKYIRPQGRAHHFELDSMFKLHYMVLISWLKSNDYAGYKYSVNASSRKLNRRNIEMRGFHILLTRENKEHQEKNVHKLRECAVRTVINFYCRHIGIIENLMHKKITRKYNQASHLQTNYNYLNVCIYFQIYWEFYYISELSGSATITGVAGNDYTHLKSSRSLPYSLPLNSNFIKSCNCLLVVIEKPS